MADGLPTLARDWASLGASNAPKTDVAADSRRIATALNTFASYIDADRKVYISVRRPLMQAQANGRRINVFLGRSRMMQCVSFDDVPGSAGRLRSATVSSVALGTDAPNSDNILVCRKS